MAKITLIQLKNLVYRISEAVGSRGDGALLFERRSTGIIEAYYRYKHQGKESKIKIGQCQTTRDGHGYSLAECRDKAQSLANLRRECGGDLKGHLSTLELMRQQHEAERRQAEAAEAAKGSFADLIKSYLTEQERLGRSTISQTRQALNLNVTRSFPAIAAKKAKDITPDDIVTILAAIHNRGSEAESVRVRSILHAVFSFGLKGDYDPTRVGEKRFYLQYNPVAATKKNTSAAQVCDRVLSPEEVKQLWERIGETHCVGFILGRFIRFMLATGGQRPLQLLRARWSDYDFARNCVTLRDAKGNGGVKVHVVPLSQRALSIIEEVKAYTEDYPWPFCTGVASRKAETKGELVPIDINSLKNAFTRYNQLLIDEAKETGRPEPEWFTARDIRRSVKNLLVDAGVSREQRNLLQSHGQTGVDVKHYDRHEHLPEKRESIRRYDALLGRILRGEETKLVDLEQYRQATSNEQA